MNRKSLVGCLTAALVLSGAACSAPARTTTASSTTAASNPTSATAPSTVPSSTPALAVVPTTIEPTPHVGGAVLIPSVGSTPPVQVTLLNIVDPAAGADQFAVPVAGDRFIGVRLQIAIGGTTPFQDDLAGDTSIEDSQGSSYSSSNANLQNCTAFKAGLTIGPGAVKTGCVAFEVSSSTTITDVTFTPGGPLGNVSAEWDVP